MPAFDKGKEGANLSLLTACGLRGQIPASRNELTKIEALTHSIQAFLNTPAKAYLFRGMDGFSILY